MSDETVLGRLLAFVRDAGAPTEGSTERNGAFSYHAETHAVGMGVGLGIAAGATGETRYLGIAVSAVTTLNRGAKLTAPKVAEDVRQEPHYFFGGFALGYVIGAVSGGRLTL